MKIFNKLVKSVSAFVAAAVVSLSGSAVFADGVNIWNAGTSTTAAPDVFLRGVKSSTTGKFLGYKVFENPHSKSLGTIRAVGSNKWVYKDSDKTEYTITKINDSKYSASHYNPDFEMDVEAFDLEKHGNEWRVKVGADYMVRILKVAPSKLKVFGFGNDRFVETVGFQGVSEEIVNIITGLSCGCLK